MITVLYTDVTALSDDTFYKKALLTLPEERVIKAEKLKVKNAKMLSVGASLMLGECLKRKNLSFGSALLCEDENKKPYIKNFDIHFSLSHSNSLAICAVSDKEIGIDAEKKSFFNPSIIERFFTQNEKDEFSKYSDTEKSDAFFRMWTIKEAYAKMTGSGLASFKDFSVSLLPVVHIKEAPKCFIKEFDKDGYAISLCSMKEDDIEFEKVEINKIIR